MKAKNLLFSFSLLASLALGGAGVFAAYTVTDSAPKTGIRIGISSVSTITVSFLDENGDVSYSEEVIQGGKLSNAPSNPTLSGYTFDGWATNAKTLEKVDVDFSTKTFTENTTYSPRFASYGYKLGSASPQHISNNRGYDDKVEVAASTSVNFGTYIYGKSSLENDTGASSTEFSKAGYYAFTCNGEGTNWDGTKSSKRSNWNVERYYELTIPSSLTTSYGLFSHFFNNGDTERKTEVITDNLVNTVGTSKTYFTYGKHDLTNVIFGLLGGDNKTSVESNWSNVHYQTSTKAISNDYQFEVGMKTVRVQWPTYAQGDVYMLGGYSTWTKTSTTIMAWTQDDYWEKTFFDFVGTSFEYKFGRSWNNSEDSNYIEWEYSSGSNRTFTIDSGVNIETKTKGNPSA